VDPVLVRPGGGEYVSRGATREVAILCDFEQLTVTVSRYAAGERGPDPHVHRCHVDAFYVLEGEMAYTFGREDRTVVAGAGTFVLVPIGVVHTFANQSEHEVRWLNFHAPDAGFAAFLRGDASGFDSEDPPPDRGRPADDALVSGPSAGDRLEREDRVLEIKGEVPELSAIEIAFDPSFTVDPHSHPDPTDAFWVLEREVEFTVGDDAVVAEAGTFVAAPPDSRHGFRNPGAARAKILNLHGPDAGFADSIRRFRPS